MNDLIERLRETKDTDPAADYDFGWNDAIDYAIAEMSMRPGIIRCKDCRYWTPGYITDQDVFIPPKCGKYQQMVGHSGDDFCSQAERKQDEQENNL